MITSNPQRNITRSWSILNKHGLVMILSAQPGIITLSQKSLRPMRSRFCSAQIFIEAEEREILPLLVQSPALETLLKDLKKKGYQIIEGLPAKKKGVLKL